MSKITEIIKEKLKEAGDGAYVSRSNAPRAHRQVKDVAKGMCLDLYEHFCSQIEGFSQAYPDPEAFAKAYWIHFCSEARATLAALLGSNISDHLKEQAYRAIILDESLVATRAQVPQVKMDV